MTPSPAIDLAASTRSPRGCDASSADGRDAEAQIEAQTSELVRLAEADLARAPSSPVSSFLLSGGRS